MDSTVKRLTANSQDMAKAIIETARSASMDGVLVDPAMIVSSDDPIAIAMSLFTYGEAYVGRTGSFGMGPTGNLGADKIQ